MPNENPNGLGKFEFPLRFTGQVADKETGLFQNYFRDYDPAIGAYKQSDLIGLGGGINTFAYVKGNPLKWVDPLGLDTYVANRDLSAIGGTIRPWWDTVTHTFTFSTNPDGSIAATYSWGNSANLNGWNLNQPEDIKAAVEALKNGDAKLVGLAFMDTYYRKVLKCIQD